MIAVPLVNLWSLMQTVEVESPFSNAGMGAAAGFQRLASDQLGLFSLSLTNVVTGSAVQVEVVSTGAVISNTTATGSTVALSIPVYSSGSPLNDLRIKVRKGSSAPFYQPYETQATAVVGAQSIYVSQIPDE